MNNNRQQEEDKTEEIKFEELKLVPIKSLRPIKRPIKRSTIAIKKTVKFKNVTTKLTKIFPLKKKTVPQPFIYLAKTQKGVMIRPATVLKGIPFYASSGLNSGQKATWFPFLGFTETWLIKPNLNHFKTLPEKLLIFIDENKLTNDIEINRFGTLVTMCISASIGTGYWQTEVGKKLKIYLQENYIEYFLDVANFHKHFKEFIEGKNPFLVKQRNLAYFDNQSLIINRDSETARLPSHQEFNLLKDINPKSTPILKIIRTIFNQQKYMLDKNLVILINQLNKLGLINYPQLDYFFENKDQIQKLLELANSNQLSIEALNQINPFPKNDKHNIEISYSHVRELIWHFRKHKKDFTEEHLATSMAIYNKLNENDRNENRYYKDIVNQQIHDAIKQIIALDLLNIKALRLGNFLYKKQLISYCLEHKFFQNTSLTKLILTMPLSEINQEKLEFMKQLTQMFNNEPNANITKTLFELLFSMYKKNKLNKENVRLVKKIHEHHLLKKSLSFIKISNYQSDLIEVINQNPNETGVALESAINHFIKNDKISLSREIKKWLSDNEICQKLIKNKISYQFLKQRSSQDALNKDIIHIAILLQKENLLKACQPYLDIPHFVDKLQMLLVKGNLSKKNIELLIQDEIKNEMIEQLLECMDNDHHHKNSKETSERVRSYRLSINSLTEIIKNEDSVFVDALIILYKSNALLPKNIKLVEYLEKNSLLELALPLLQNKVDRDNLKMKIEFSLLNESKIINMLEKFKRQLARQHKLDQFMQKDNHFIAQQVDPPKKRNIPTKSVTPLFAKKVQPLLPSAKKMLEKNVKLIKKNK